MPEKFKTGKVAVTTQTPPCKNFADNRTSGAPLKTFEQVYQDWLNFVCDGTCNDKSDVCCHFFVWSCPSCGQRRETIGESMPDVQAVTKGDCDECFTLINYDAHEIEEDAANNIQNGFRRLRRGKLLKGDMVWNADLKKFERVKLDGNVLIEQCYFVIRSLITFV